MLSAENISLILIVGGVMTLAIAVIALAIFRRAVARNMVDADNPVPPEWLRDENQARRAADVSLLIKIESQRGERIKFGDRVLRRFAIAHAVAGFAFALAAAPFMVFTGETKIAPERIVVATWVCTWAFAWPIVPVLCLVVGPDRRAQARVLLSYFGGLALACVAGWLQRFDAMNSPDGSVTFPGIILPALLWARLAAPSLFLLLFLNRAVRAIGPVVLLFALVALLCSYLVVGTMVSEPLLQVTSRFAIESGLGAYVTFWGIVAIGMLLGIWPAWRSAVFLSERYAAKWFGDLTLIVTMIWFLEALLLGSVLLPDMGALAIPAAVVPLVVWRLVLSAGLRRLTAAARTRAAPHLLLLRVFGFSRRSQRLLDVLGAHWRVLGSIDLIAAPDVASHAIEPSTFLRFIRGALAQLFIRTPGDLERRLATIDRKPDPDGRFRINQLFCAGEIWRVAVTRLMREASLVVMDLRGFEPERRGCVFELQALLDTVPLDRLVLLVDGTTNRGFLENLLTARWQELDVDSPNLTLPRAELRLLDATGSDTRAVRQLLSIAATVPP